MAEGYHAYNEFLEGLTKINQQEFVYPTSSGAKIKNEKLVAFSTVSGFWDMGRLQQVRREHASRT